ncbi:MAG: GntR family transcriptional regulator [Firmicutes bacterium]|nr:GntR family transcriptional regulator [Bacillota bacterium]
MKDQVYELIRQRIYAQHYLPGEEIKILSLSNELGVSNTPIREALNVLAAEGLLSTSMNNKFRVVELNEEMNVELNETIKVLLTGGYLTAHKDGRDAGLEGMLKERFRRQKEILKTGDDHEYLLSTISFDKSFVEITGNKKLIKMFDDNSYLFYLFIRHTIWKEEGNREKALSEHEQLIKAVSANDSKLVTELLEKHYDKPFD